MDEAYRKLGELMKEMIASRRSELQASTTEDHDPASRKHDLFTRLVYASLSEEKRGLSEGELVRFNHTPPSRLLMYAIDWGHVRVFVCWPR